MDGGENRSEREQTASPVQGGSPGPEFRPVQIETTRELDLTGLNDEESRSLRERAFDVRRDENIVNDVLGLTAERARPSPTFIRAHWGKWGEFPQVIRQIIQTGGEEPTSQNVLKESVTRIYHAEP